MTPKKLIVRISPLINIFYNYNLKIKTNQIKSIILFQSIKNQFKNLGSNLSINYPFMFKGMDNISIGDDFYSGPNLTIEAWKSYQNDDFSPEIKIGNGVSLLNDCQISCSNKICIGNNVLIGRYVFITDNYHGKSSSEDLMIPPGRRRLYSKGPVVIEDNVWIGRGVSILSGVTIGHSSVVGANSVVTHDIPPNCLAVGSPAKVINRGGEKGIDEKN